MNTTAIKSAFSSRWSLFWHGWKVRGDVLGLCGENEYLHKNYELKNAIDQIAQLRLALAEKDAQISVLQEAHRAEMEAHALTKKGNATLLRFVHQSHHLDQPIEQGTARGVLATAVGLVLMLFTLTANAAFPPPFIHNHYDTNLSPATTLTGDVTGAGYITIPTTINPRFVTNNSTGVTLSGTFSGNGAGMTNLAATNLVGVLPDGRLSGNVALLNGTNIFNGNTNSIIILKDGRIAISTNSVLPDGVSQFYILTSDTLVFRLRSSGPSKNILFQILNDLGHQYTFSMSGSSSSLAIGLGSDASLMQSNGTNGLGVAVASGAPIIFFVDGTELLRMDPFGRLKFSSVTSSNPPTSGASTSWIFTATNNTGTAEIFTMDGAGVVKQISEHAMDGPTNIYDLTDPFPNVSKEWNPYLGYVRWINRSREAVVAQAVIELAANSYEAWVGIQAGSNVSLLANNNVWTTNRINWAQSAMGTNWYLQMKQFVLANKASRNVSTVESFSDYNARLGLSPGDSGYMQMASWTNNQQQIQLDYATSFTNALTAYNSILASTNTAAISNAVAPVWNPPPVQPVPTWLKSRGVN